MRPPAERQSALRAPLNDVLSTEANVRVLRVLSGSQTPLGKSEVARRAALNPSGVRRALAALIALGIVEPVGAGPRQPVTLHAQHPLAAALRVLFESERDLFDRFLDRLRDTVARLHPPPDSVWVEGPVARGDDRPGDTVVVGVLAGSRDVDAIGRELEGRTVDLMADFDVIIEVQRWTPADLATVPRPQWSGEEAVIAILGPPPGAFVAGRHAAARSTAQPARLHADLDRRALELARFVANRIVEDPSLVDAARRFVKRRLIDASPRERRDLLEWQTILDRLSVRQLGEFLLHRGERATRLRQSLPFVDVVSRHERESIREGAGE